MVSVEREKGERERRTKGDGGQIMEGLVGIRWNWLFLRVREGFVLRRGRPGSVFCIC